MEYLNRVKGYIDLAKIKSKSDLEIQLNKKGLLGKVRQYKQINILTDELDFERVKTGEPIAVKEDIYKQSFKVKGKWRTVYRDSKGRFVKYER